MCASKTGRAKSIKRMCSRDSKERILGILCELFQISRRSNGPRARTVEPLVQDVIGDRGVDGIEMQVLRMFT
ncbi:hypothetical protein Baya_12856 [Bagarius yarrelli]|uniref:Uncharacterized protein n=1 Tax=Bagarius yarrelli TaxID=175774 RepID=A0A556V4A8_BAGYA|nr:hypothetical protein Baya_12856 [Bagarius yarrelli]